MPIMRGLSLDADRAAARKNTLVVVNARSQAVA